MECELFEIEPGKWYYTTDDESGQAISYGPFRSSEAAKSHSQSNYPNRYDAWHATPYAQIEKLKPQWKNSYVRAAMNAKKVKLGEGLEDITSQGLAARGFKRVETPSKQQGNERSALPPIPAGASTDVSWVQNRTIDGKPTKLTLYDDPNGWEAKYDGENDTVPVHDEIDLNYVLKRSRPVDEEPEKVTYRSPETLHAITAWANPPGPQAKDNGEGGFLPEQEGKQSLTESTRYNCEFYEIEPNKWYYALDNTEPENSYEYSLDWISKVGVGLVGPFDSIEKAENHLQRNEANPGGWDVYKYDKISPKVRAGLKNILLKKDWKAPLDIKNQPSSSTTSSTTPPKERVWTPEEIELSKLVRTLRTNREDLPPRLLAGYDAALKRYKELKAKGVKMEEGIEDNAYDIAPPRNKVMDNERITPELLTKLGFKNEPIEGNVGSTDLWELKFNHNGKSDIFSLTQHPLKAHPIVKIPSKFYNADKWYGIFDTLPEGKGGNDADYNSQPYYEFQSAAALVGVLRKVIPSITSLTEGLEDVIDTPEKEVGEIEKEEPAKEVEVDVVAVSDEKTEEAPKKSSNKNTPTSTKFSIKDDNSAPTSDVKREQGVKSSGIKEYNATGKVVPETTSPVAREMGVKSGRKEVEKTDHGTKKEVELAQSVGREEGVKSAPKAYMEGYKETISKSLQNIKESFSI